MTVAFRMGHTLVRNNFQQLRGDFTRFRPPLPERNSFLNNRSIFRDGIEPVMRGLFGDQGDAEDFDSAFSASIGRTMFIPPGQGGFQNLLALNIHRGTDHGLASYSRCRSLCRIPNEASSGSNPFSIYMRQIRNPTTLHRLRRAYGSPKNHVDLFVGGIAESNNNNQLLGPTFQYIIKTSLQNVRDGDRFFFRNTGVFSPAQYTKLHR